MPWIENSVMQSWSPPHEDERIRTEQQAIIHMHLQQGLAQFGYAAIVIELDNGKNYSNELMSASFTAASGSSLRWRSDAWPSQQRTRFAFGTMATPRTRRGFTRRPFPIRPSARCTCTGGLSVREEGDVLTVEFTVMGIPCLGLNGGPGVKHNWAFSFQVATADQAETDRYYNAIVGNGGQESACGWCTDKWGLSWQITPIALTESDHRSRYRCRRARVRGDDDDAKDRHRCNRGGAPRLRLHLRAPRRSPTA
jgi:hypothetical protein